ITAAQAGLEASSTSTQGRPAACSAATTTGSACSWLYTGITAQGLWKATCVAIAALRAGSECSFSACKLRFFACSCLALAASPTLSRGSLDTGGPQQNPPGGAGGLAVAEGEVQLAARGVETQAQL